MGMREEVQVLFDEKLQLGETHAEALVRLAVLPDAERQLAPHHQVFVRHHQVV